MLSSATGGEDGRLLVTPEYTSFEKIEGQIHSPQKELRERARRAFQAAYGKNIQWTGLLTGRTHAQV